MKKCIKILTIVLLCITAFPKQLLANVQEAQSEVIEKEGKTEKQKIVTFLKKHKKKIGAVVAIALIFYFFGRGPGRRPAPPVMVLIDKPNENKYEYIPSNLGYYIQTILYRIRLTGWNMNFLIYLIKHHPRALLRGLKNGYALVEIEEIANQTICL